MISNQVLQTTLDGLKAISRVDLCVLDTEGIMLATTFPEAEGFRDSVLSFADSPADSQVVSGCQFFKVFDEHQLEYVLLANGNSDDVHMVGRMAAFQIQNLLVAYKERFDKDNFIKNLLLDNLLLVDIYNRAKKLHIDTEARRVVFILEISNEKENNSLETVRALFNSKSGDFITAVDEKNIIVVKELGAQDGTYGDGAHCRDDSRYLLARRRKRKRSSLTARSSGEIKEVSRSYKEARMALDVGKIFFEEQICNRIQFNLASDV